MNELASHEPVAYHGHREPSSRPAEMSPVGITKRVIQRAPPSGFGAPTQNSTCGTKTAPLTGQRTGQQNVAHRNILG
jgi:hypothetical protein